MKTASLYYIDASALAKLVLPEAESKALLDLTKGSELVSSEIIEIELKRAVMASDKKLLSVVERVLQPIELLSLDQNLRNTAGTLQPDVMRSLDAIHLASALHLSKSIDGMICYDRRLAAAATDAGLTVLAPTPT